MFNWRWILSRRSTGTNILFLFFFIWERTFYNNFFFLLLFYLNLILWLYYPLHLFQQIPGNPKKPCELCYCIRNMTSCVMQECTLHVDGCRPIYNKGVCCPVRYDCGKLSNVFLMIFFFCCHYFISNLNFHNFFFIYFKIKQLVMMRCH